MLNDPAAEREKAIHVCRLTIMLILLLLLLLLLPPIACKGCTLKRTETEPLHIPHEWYQPGDVIIGGIVSHIHCIFHDLHFKTHPSQESIDFPLYEISTASRVTYLHSISVTVLYLYGCNNFLFGGGGNREKLSRERKGMNGFFIHCHAFW